MNRMVRHVSANSSVRGKRNPRSLFQHRRCCLIRNLMPSVTILLRLTLPRFLSHLYPPTIVRVNMQTCSLPSIVWHTSCVTSVSRKAPLISTVRNHVSRLMNRASPSVSISNMPKMPISWWRSLCCSPTKRWQKV